MSVEGPPLDHKGHIRKLFVVELVRYSLEKLLFAVVCKVPLRARIRIQLEHVLEVVLAEAASDDVQLGSLEGHRVACSHLRVLLNISKRVTVLPCRGVRIERVQVVEALCVGTGATKQIQLLLHIAQRHASTRRWTLSLNCHLTPQSLV